MVRSHEYRPARLIALMFLLLLGQAACSARYDSPGSSSSGPRVNSPLENECERELLHLDALIEAKRMDDRLRAEVLAELMELRRAAAEMFMKGEFELALELIEEAVAMLEETG